MLKNKIKASLKRSLFESVKLRMGETQPGIHCGDKPSDQSSPVRVFQSIVRATYRSRPPCWRKMTSSSLSNSAVTTKFLPSLVWNKTKKHEEEHFGKMAKWRTARLIIFKIMPIYLAFHIFFSFAAIQNFLTSRIVQAPTENCSKTEKKVKTCFQSPSKRHSATHKALWF